MIGHRMPECVDLVASIAPKLRQVFRTERPVFIAASSGTGMQEAAVRNTVRRRALNCVNGAFADRWRQVTEANGKENEVLEVQWGQPVLPDQVASRLSSGLFDAVTIVHNETSTGVLSPIAEIASAIRALPNGDEIIILVDAVSGVAGAQLEFDDWDLDVVLTSSQKAFALPPGLAFCAVSERAMRRAASVENRGYYFDFLVHEKYMRKNQTAATPAISLLYALDEQLNDFMAESMEGRWQRHLDLQAQTALWLGSAGFNIFAAKDYRSPTVTCVSNNLGVDIGQLNKFLRSRGMIISGGYGKLKDETFRIAHMGDTTSSEMAALFAAIDSFLGAT